MATGFKFRTPAGVLLVDAAVPQMKLFTKYTVTADDTRTINSLPSVPVVALGSNIGADVAVTYSNGSATIRVYHRPGDSGSTTVYVFAAPNGSNVTRGIKLYNNGKVTFDSSRGYLKIVGSGGGNPDTSGGENNAQSWPSGKSYATIVRQVGYSFRDVNQGAGGNTDWYRYVFRGYAKVSGLQTSVISYNSSITHYGGSAPVDASPYISAQLYYVVDVTGL
ncbi:hypothetical protein EA658_20345 [Pseudoxanthomonas winnipegensis]|uniref:Uncharacterized protein n=1 Tax=Pseudoxanthomonas winnipegensis TaxID=2480810 RepID=A0ABY1W8X5_9GAMM|nr:hypothetical protein [Pseudoxanthomonas winnipegensis]TAA08229.1 hypothetical protein EA659_16235 [Pseudoxanthomonas winnipegensis]TAA16237.1 hypothetical protein EA658_20345 [Pseudoxanthomonas winnipegensis]TAH72690.1 hypothetical protein EA657_10660 [Pseudoxanthomonas winnipegensis]